MTESMPDADDHAEYLVDNDWIVGGPETVARKLRALYDDVGGFGAVLIGASEWPDPAVWDRSMTLLATEVMPRWPTSARPSELVGGSR